MLEHICIVRNVAMSPERAQGLSPLLALQAHACQSYSSLQSFFPDGQCLVSFTFKERAHSNFIGRRTCRSSSFCLSIRVSPPWSREEMLRQKGRFTMKKLKPKLGDPFLLGSLSIKG